MATPPTREFGKRQPATAQAAGPAAAPVKRSGHVALLVMGTMAVGGGAYALMARDNCQPPSSGMAAPALPRTNAQCASGSGGGHGVSSASWSRRNSLFGGDSSSGGSSPGPSSESGSTTRGGFGSFARSFASHFSFGG
jgi:hypothetical protein